VALFIWGLEIMATTIQNIIDIVLADTKRPDRISQIQQYVKKAIKHAHQLTDFKQDRLDTTLVPSPIGDGLIGSVALPSDFRKEKLIRPIAAGSFFTGVKLVEIPLDDLPKYEIAGKALDTYYITQGTLHYNSENVLDSIGFMYYAYPDLSTLSKTTWITNQYEEAITDLAKSWMYASIGDKENANKLFADWRISAVDIKNSD